MAYPSFIFHVRHLSGFFLNVPSPLQGTSHRTLSNRNLSCLGPIPGKCWAGWLVTTILLLLLLCNWWIRVLARLASTSFATINPSPLISSIMWAVFEPGAAHMSSTIIPGYISNKSPGNILTSSCLETKPLSWALCINAWSCLTESSLLSSDLLELICQARLSGYQWTRWIMRSDFESPPKFWPHVSFWGLLEQSATVLIGWIDSKSYR